MAEDIEAQLATSLRREAALAGVLNAVAQGGDLDSVLTELASWAAELTRSSLGLVFVSDGEVVATYMSGPEREPTRGHRPFGDDSALTKVLRDRVTLAFDDQSNIPDQGFGQSIEAARLLGIRSSAFAPMRSEGPPVGVAAFRLAVEPFTTDEIELLETFAVQAGNAVTNARLLADIEQRNAELAEALELQTATAEVLRLIGEHPGDLETVLQGVLTKAAELCGGEAGSITVSEGPDTVRYAASYGPAMEPYIGTTVQTTELDRSIFTVRVDGVNHVDDFAAAVAGTSPYFEELTRVADVRSYAVASLTSGGMPIGGLHMYRHEVRPFSDAEQNRLASFAAQASLAIANAKLFNDLDQALERQRAMTDVLEAVSTARFDIQPVFDRIVEHAAHLCDDTAALVTIRDRAELSVMAGAGWGELGNQDVLHWDAIDTSTTTGTVFSTGEPVHIPDWDEVPPDRYPNSKARDSGLRTMLTLPMRRHHVVIGAMTFARATPGGYDTSEQSLLQAFTDQAAIAVDNARLLQEIEQRNAELGESLELQTATSEILQLISAHPGDLTTVLNGILEKAAAISEADVGAAMLRISPAGVGQQVVRAEAIFGEHMAPLSGREFPLVGPPPDARESRQPVLADDFSTMELTESVAAVAQEFGLRSRVSVSLFDDDDWIGNLNLYRHEVRPFGQKQAAVLQAFADQASIAIANARLFNDLDESLERQQAMTDVLDAVSTARFDLQPVVDRIAHHADRLCGGTGVGVSVVYGDHLRPVSGTGHFADGFAANPDLRIPIDASSPVGDSARTGQVVHVRNWDEMADDVYPNAGSRAAGRKSALTVPMVRNDTVVGVFGFSRVEPGGYTDSEISLLQTFANQAAIAVDNARLLTEIEQRNSELSESLELQTATSDILRLISAHPGDLTTVLEGIAGRAATLCDAEVGSVLLRHGDILRIEAESATMEGTQSLVGREFIADRTINRRARDSREPVFLDDFQDVHDSVGLQVARDLPDLHSFATIALLLDDEWIGNLNLSRTEVRPFDPKIAPIMQAFADQAAIAVANAKLFNDLDAALERQTAMTDVLDAVSTARTDLQPVFDRIVEHAQRLCDDTAAFVSVRVEGDVVTVAGAGAGAGADGYLGIPMTR